MTDHTDLLRAEMLSKRDEILAKHPEVTRAYELDPLLPEHLRQPYWEWQLENMAQQLHYAPGDRPSVTDAPNLTATSKPAIDGLVDAGIVPTDTDKHVEITP